MNPLISVVIPTHNRSNLLVRAINSVLNQTYGNIEIIVVSDGSTDETKSVVKEFMENDNRIRFIEYYPAKGGNVARNTGIEAASGVYVAFLDDDDEWYLDKLESQLNIVEKSENIGLVYTGVRIIYVNENIKYTFCAKEQGNLRKKILLNNCIGTTSTVMVKKELLKKTGVFDENLKALQDYDLWIRICQVCNVGVVPEEKIKYYNYTGKKQVSAVTQKYIDAFSHIDKKYESLFVELSNNDKNVKRIREYMLLANKAMRNSDKKLCRHFVRKALKIKFSVGPLMYWFLSFTNFKFVLRMRSIF